MTTGASYNNGVVDVRGHRVQERLGVAGVDRVEPPLDSGLAGRGPRVRRTTSRRRMVHDRSLRDSPRSAEDRLEVGRVEVRRRDVGTAEHAQPAEWRAVIGR